MNPNVPGIFCCCSCSLPLWLLLAPRLSESSLGQLDTVDIRQEQRLTPLHIIYCDRSVPVHLVALFVSAYTVHSFIRR
ncbi:hypothetical protein CPB85DRAFT_1312286 [Mucidula mucida]|nr:hypothetical protein CPB85DRAFT_1312286 [Mucidula mucida]